MTDSPTGGSDTLLPAYEPLRTELFRLLVQSVLDYAIFMLDPNGKILSWNEGAERIKGYRPNEIIGQHFSIFYPPEDLVHGKPQRVLATAATQGRWEEESWRLRKDGSRFWAHVTLTAIREPDGQLVGFAKVTRDLTERKRAEEERDRLLELERAARSETQQMVKRLQAVQSVTEAALAHLEPDDLLQEMMEKIQAIMSVDTVAVLLLDEDADTLVARASKGIEEEVEQQVRIPVGQGFAGSIVARRQPIVLPEVTASSVVNPILLQKGIRSLAGVPLATDNRVIGVLHVGSLTPRNFSGTETQFLQIVADRVALALEHARLIEAAQIARRDVEIAEATVRARDEFLSVAGHELRTPIASLRLATQLALRGFQRETPPNPARLLEALHRIDRQSDRLSRLITQLLETARHQERRLELQRAPTNLSALVRNAVDALRSGSERHEFVLSLPDELSAEVDALRLEQVVGNLVENAIKFSPAGGSIEISLSQPRPDTARLAVQDHGLGVAPDHRAHLFERFYQAHSGDYRSGMGLGLYISHEIVSMHGGTIQLEFPDDGGTSAVVDLPIAPGTPEPS